MRKLGDLTSPWMIVGAGADEASRSVGASSRNRARVLVVRIRQGRRGRGAVAEVARSVPRVDALAVAADAHVRCGVPCRLPARLSTDHPVQQQQLHLPAGGCHEVPGGDVGGAEVERGGLHERTAGVAAGAEARDGRGGVEAVVELHAVRVDALGGMAAWQQPMAAQEPFTRVRARGHAAGHVMYSVPALTDCTYASE